MATPIDARRTGMRPHDVEPLAATLAAWLLAYGAPTVTLHTGRKRLEALLDSLPASSREVLLTCYTTLVRERPSEIDEGLRAAADPTIKLPEAA